MKYRVLGHSLKQQINTNKNYIADKNTYSQTPSEEEIKETKKLLSDFRIKVKIPQFETLAEMRRWAKDLIRQKLAE